VKIKELVRNFCFYKVIIRGPIITNF